MKTIRHIHSVLVATSLLASFGIVNSFADDSAAITASETAALTKMEDRLIEHDYHKDSIDARIARLEKFVFGGPETGTIPVRIARLQAAIVPAAHPTEPAYVPASQSKTGAPVQTAAKPPVYDKSDYGTYPRVEALESTILGKTYDSDPLPVRLARLETKEYGKPSTENDMGDRIDKLDRLVMKTNPVSPRFTAAAPNSPADMSPYQQRADSGMDAPAKPALVNPFSPGQPAINSVEQRTDTLEKFVFGHEHLGKPLGERVAKLEKKLIPYEHQADKDLATRVDHLWTMLSAANTMNNSPISPTED